MSKWYRYPIQNNLINEYSLKVTERTIQYSLPHWHDFYELEIILSGMGTTTINGIEYSLSPNTLYMLTPTDYHSHHANDNNQLSILNLTFSPDCIEDLRVSELISLTNYFFIELDSDTTSQLTFLIKKIKAEYSSPNYMSQKYISSLMACILIDLLRLQKKSLNVLIENTDLPLPAQKALYYIRSHFREPITLDDISRFSGFSSNYMSKVFHESFDVSFKEYLLSLRLQHAEQLLLLSKESITDISYYCGFNSCSHFLHMFKTRYGISPLQFRKKQNTKPELFMRL